MDDGVKQTRGVPGRNGSALFGRTCAIGATIARSLRTASYGFAVLASAFAGTASAQTLAETRDAVEMMVATASICSDYLGRPEVLTEWEDRGRVMLSEAGMPAGEADSFVAQVIEVARAETNTEIQKQVACEIVNIPTLKVE